jgi:hypothetical protein
MRKTYIPPKRFCRQGHPCTRLQKRVYWCRVCEVLEIRVSKLSVGSFFFSKEESLDYHYGRVTKDELVEERRQCLKREKQNDR